MSMQKRYRALWLVAMMGSAWGCTEASAAVRAPPSAEAFWPLLLKLIASPSLRIDPMVAGAAVGVPADRFRHIESSGRDDPGGDVLGPDQGWTFFLDLPYADMTSTKQGARFSFVKEWPVRRTTALPMCIDADRARVDITGVGWSYLGKTTDWSGKPWSSFIVARFERQLAGSTEQLLVFYNSVSEADDLHGCLFHLEIDTEPVLAGEDR